MELQNSAMFWSMTEQRLGANTKSIFKDQTLEVRLVNDARSLKLILLAQRNDEVAAGGMDFEWYTQVAGGAIMTAAASVLHRPVNRPDGRYLGPNMGSWSPF
ncbi:hypothetical protein ATDW_35890 (plasmid) [Asticcacaulis sp. DW145]|uniref:hypothetical protein n=1 Tax=Asticcacaulis sp. DW145 TaxID=3095608 RepID=UPI0030898B4C|nr:hypothetical protein ATDW_35890 [Asticcacaulis sp. DW145]